MRSSPVVVLAFLVGACAPVMNELPPSYPQVQEEEPEIDGDDNALEDSDSVTDTDDPVLCGDYDLSKLYASDTISHPTVCSIPYLQFDKTAPDTSLTKPYVEWDPSEPLIVTGKMGLHQNVGLGVEVLGVLIQTDLPGIEEDDVLIDFMVDGVTYPLGDRYFADDLPPLLIGDVRSEIELWITGLSGDPDTYRGRFVEASYCSLDLATENYIGGANCGNDVFFDKVEIRVTP